MPPVISLTRGMLGFLGSQVAGERRAMMLPHDGGAERLGDADTQVGPIRLGQIHHVVSEGVCPHLLASREPFDDIPPLRVSMLLPFTVSKTRSGQLGHLVF